MAETQSTKQKQWQWWIAVVVVPILLALIHRLWSDNNKPPPEKVNYTNFDGIQVNRDVSFNSVRVVTEQARDSGVELPDQVVEALTQAMNDIKPALRGYRAARKSRSSCPRPSSA